MSCDKCGHINLFSPLYPEIYGFNLCKDCETDLKFVIAKFVSRALKK